jgi:predicted acetyltransferase
MVLIRPLTSADRRDEYLDLHFRSFGSADPEHVWAEAQAAIAGGRCLAAFDDGHLIGTASYLDLRQWWLGRAVPMAGVAGVKIAPEYRGQGVGRALMTALTQLMTERGYPLSALYPATSPIYRQLGWERAGPTCTTAVPSRSLLALARPDRPSADRPSADRPSADWPSADWPSADSRPPGPHPGPHRPGPEDAAEVLAVLGRAHELARDCGPVTFDEQTVRRWLTAGRWAGDDRYAYLAGDGFLAYAWNGGHDAVIVDKLVAVSPETTRALWSVVASNASIAGTVRARVSPADPLWWLLREQDADPAGGYWWMLRLLDARAAIAARGFPAIDIDIPLDITDDQVPANTGSWTLAIHSGSAALIPAPAQPAAPPAAQPASAAPRAPLRPLLLGACGLAALYAGTPVATLRTAGLAAGGTPGSDAALDSAFAATAFMLDTF